MSNVQFDLVQRMSNAITALPKGELRDLCKEYIVRHSTLACMEASGTASKSAILAQQRVCFNNEMEIAQFVRGELFIATVQAGPDGWEARADAILNTPVANTVAMVTSMAYTEKKPEAPVATAKEAPVESPEFIGCVITQMNLNTIEGEKLAQQWHDAMTQCAKAFGVDTNLGRACAAHASFTFERLALLSMRRPLDQNDRLLAGAEDALAAQLPNIEQIASQSDSTETRWAIWLAGAIHNFSTEE